MDKINALCQEIEDIFIDAAADLASSLSINPIVGQIYALLYIRPQPVSLDEIAEKLKISKGNVCINIRVLESWQAVKKVWIKGSRKDYYTAETDFIKIALNRLKEGLSRRLDMGDVYFEKIKSILENSKRQFDKGGEHELEFYKSRIKQLQEIRNLLEDVLKILPSIDLLRQKNKFFKLFDIIKVFKKL